MKTVIFCRHGEAVANAEGLLAGSRTDSELTAKGEQQAHDLSQQLHGKTIDLIVSSPLFRAHRTAEIAGSDIGYTGGILVNELFTERDFGSATNMPREQAFAALDSGTATDVESIEDFANRATQALAWLRARPETNIAVFSHAAFGQMIGTMVQGGNPEDFLSYKNLLNGGVFEFTIDESPDELGEQAL